MTERILVTGSRGFLAAHLIDELRRRRPGARLFLSHRSPSPGHIACDLLDREAARNLLQTVRPDIIFHLAGKVGAHDWLASWRANVQATGNLLEAARLREGCRGARVIITGSAAEYGAPAILHRRPAPVRENDCCEPLTEYGRIKRCQTLYALSYRHAGVRVLLARVFNVLGPGMPEHLALGSFAGQIARIERTLLPPLIRVGNLAPRRDYVDVRDAAAALVALSRRGKDGEVYNVCSGRSHSIGDLLRDMLAFSGKKIEVLSESSRHRSVDVPDIYGSNRKLAADTGWKPHIPLGESLKDTLEWHRAAQKLARPA